MADDNIQSYETLQIVNLIVFILCMLAWLVSVVGFFLLRNVQPFKARSFPLLFLLLCCVPVNSIKYFLILRGTEDCVRDSWIEGKHFHSKYFCIVLFYKRLSTANFLMSVFVTKDLFSFLWQRYNVYLFYESLQTLGYFQCDEETL